MAVGESLGAWLVYACWLRQALEALSLLRLGQRVPRPLWLEAVYGALLLDGGPPLHL